MAGASYAPRVEEIILERKGVGTKYVGMFFLLFAWDEWTWLLFCVGNLETRLCISYFRIAKLCIYVHNYIGSHRQ